MGSNFGISNVLLHTNTHAHCKVTIGAVGLSASERGVSGNPLELVCEGLVNQREKKEQERKSGEKKK